MPWIGESRVDDFIVTCRRVVELLRLLVELEIKRDSTKFVRLLESNLFRRVLELFSCVFESTAFNRPCEFETFNRVFESTRRPILGDGERSLAFVKEVDR